ncbi:autotransporter assembly complex protein TamA [Thiolapillus sp.]
MKLLPSGGNAGIRLLLVCLLFAAGQLQAQAAEEKTTAEHAGESVNAGKVQLVVEISGLEGALLENAQAYLGLLQKKDDPNLTEQWIKHLHEKAVEEIRQALQPFGYYNARVEASLENSAGKWIASYVVHPGPRVVVSRLDLKWSGEGAEEPALQRAAENFPLKKGDALDHEVYEKAKAALLELADTLGYPDVEAKTARIVVHPQANLADITLHLDTGHKYFISEIRLHQDFLEPDFVRRYLVDVKPGDTYSQENLLEIQKDLIAAGYFSLVDIKPKFREAQEYRVPVDVTLEPVKRQRYSFGIGYDTDIQVNLSMRWKHRRINRLGHKADALVKLSLVENLVQANYWVPIRDPRTTKLGFTARLLSEVLDDSKSDSLTLEAGYYFIWNKWTARLYTGFKYERFTAGAADSVDARFLSFGGRAERAYFEEGNYPRRAWSLFADLRVSPGLVSSTDYVRTHIRGKVYLPVFQEGRLILASELGLAAVGDYEQYPNSLRFFAGGDSSVRGYDWKTLGPEDEEGDVVGGRQMVTASIEYNHKVAEQWVAAGFVDAGNAFDDRLDDVYFGAGVGVRWLSPVGTVRLDFAWPVHQKDKSTEFSDLHLHFGFEVLL